MKRRNSFEPDLNQRPKDDILITTVLRSTNWAIEGIDVFMFQSRIKLSEKKSLMISFSLKTGATYTKGTRGKTADLVHVVT